MKKIIKSVATIVLLAIAVAVVLAFAVAAASGQTITDKSNAPAAVVQPSTATYPISTLYLFPSYTTRAAYQAATGQQAPPFNPAAPLKYWFDPSSPNGGTYNVFDSTAAQTGYIVALTVPASSSGVNLPGAYTYPALVEAPTVAIQVGPFGPPGSLVSPGTLSLQADAQALANKFKVLYPGVTVTVALPAAGTYNIDYGTEVRRQWGLVLSNGATYNAEAFLRDQAVNGVGAPGAWALEHPAGESTAYAPVPTWVPAAQVTTAPANAVTVPTPIRALLSNEQFFLQPPANPLFGTATWVVQNTSIAPPAAAPCVTP